MQADATPIESCLKVDEGEESSAMSRAVMEAVSTGTIATGQDVMRFVKCTLLAATSDFQVRDARSLLC